jgi:hypothetical protein
LKRQRDELRREKSLSRALKRSNERLVLLQGDPGSGKSVALRNAARALANKSIRRPSFDKRIPLYINLKELRRINGVLDSETIRAYVLGQLNQANSRDVDQFLTDEFGRGMEEGTWLFFFDSFDEIPEILTAAESGETIGEYADTLYDFLHGMNTSPGVVASREFKGPPRFGWPRFIVQPLTEPQKRELIRKAELEPNAESEVFGALASADPMVAQLSSNPMLLGLICEHVRETGLFPASSHAVFETFAESRLRRDADRVGQRFGVDPSELRQVAEEIAFQITAQPGTGLSPSRADLARILCGTDLRSRLADPTWLDRHLDALEYVKLARAPEGASSGNNRMFTYSHRRFQEYFATCVVLRKPDSVSTDSLLLDGQWRETAVAMLQTTQSGSGVSALLTEAERLLAESVAKWALAAGVSDTEDAVMAQDGPPFEWPPKSLHLLSLIDTGVAGRPQDISPSLRGSVAPLLRAAWASGRRHHQLWAVQAALLADADTTEQILEDSFSSKSRLLQRLAYRYTGRLSRVPTQLSRHMRLALIDQASQGRMLFEWPTVCAQLGRLSDPNWQLRAARLLRWLPVLSMLAPTLLFISFASSDGHIYDGWWVAGWATTMALLGVQEAFPMWGTRSASASTLQYWAMEAVGYTAISLFSVWCGVWVAGKSATFDKVAEGIVMHPAIARLSAVSLCYLLLWRISAVAAVAWGLNVRSVTWPFLPLVVFVAACPRFFKSGLRRLTRIAMNFLVAMVKLITLMSLLIWLAPYLSRSPSFNLGLFGTATIVYISIGVMSRTHDRRIVRSLNPELRLDDAAIRSIVSRLRSDNGVRQLINWIQRRRLDCTDDGIGVFEELIDAAARHRRLAATQPWWRRIFDDLVNEVWTHPLEGAISEETIDHIALLATEHRTFSTKSRRGSGTLGTPQPLRS